jgi:hypothetical protein
MFLALLYYVAMTQKNKHQPVTPPTKSTTKRASRNGDKPFESDGTYFLKLVVFVLLGTFWIKFSTAIVWMGIVLNGFPLGFFIGLILVRRFEKYQSDRKIWYAILIAITIISYFEPAGVRI